MAYEKILVINSGSSSLKFQLFDMTTETMLCKGLVERIGTEKAHLVFTPTGKAKYEEDVEAPSHSEAIRVVCNILVDSRFGVLKDFAEVSAIGHRVLHAGEEIKQPMRVDEKVKEIIRKYSLFGPLHNPANLAGIVACEEIFKGTPNVVVLDTQFHQTMPPEAYMYAIPMKFYKEDHLRKYGFHGTSHNFVAHAAAEFLKKPYDELNVVICHLGNGSSISAVKNGKCFDTTMGVTPLAGLMMGTRSGDVDPFVVMYMARKGYTPDQIDTILNKESGFKAMNGIGSADMRDTIAAADAGNTDAQNALKMFAHRVALYVGGYYTLIGGADAIIFTGGIGENSFEARKMIVDRLNALGCFINEEVNLKTRGTVAVVSTPESKLPAIVIPTNEELMIARETLRVLTQA
ncbi:MAG: acetate kinase [Kiritimatiellae bacterium]|nr:acetate kinase [Kiritimatiellia bacterium]